MNFKYVIWFGFFSMFCSCLILAANIGKSIADSKMSSYHCTPITTHTSLESAQEQVSVYQDMVRG